MTMHGRDELQERLATTLAALVALRDAVRDSGRLNGMEYDALGVEVNRAIEKAEAALLAPQEAREGERCQAVHFTRSMQCKLPARHGSEHIAGSGEGETRWTTEVADRLDASLAGPAPAEATEASGEMVGWLEVAEPCTDPFHFRLDGPTGAQQCPRCGSRMKVAPASGEPSGPYRLTGAAIRNRRTAAGMSLRELAAAVGISNVEMGEIERGIRRPDANTVTAIRNAIDAASRCGLPSPVRGYGPCILRRGHGGPGAHQHDETGRIMQAYHAPDTSEEGAGMPSETLRPCPFCGEAAPISDTAIRALNEAYDYFTRQYLEHMDANRAELAGIYNGHRVALGEVARALGLEPRTP